MIPEFQAISVVVLRNKCVMNWLMKFYSVPNLQKRISEIGKSRDKEYKSRDEEYQS